MAHVLTLPLRAISFAAARPLGRRFLVVLCLAMALAAGYWFWFRDSSLVAVRDVKVTGLSASNASQVRGALEQTARSMTTLDVRAAELRDAVRAYPTVQSISVATHFPSGMTISVRERSPTAMARGGGRNVPVAADGTVLEGVQTGAADLPAIALAGAPPGSRLHGDALDEAFVLGAAPADLRPQIARTTASGGEVTIELKAGPRLEFGSPRRAADKWDAAVRVLADPRIQTLEYIQLAVPERPAVGGGPPPPVAPVTPVGTPVTGP